MKYQEWIAQTDEQMVESNIDELIEMFSELPYGMIEPDQEKQVKLNQFLVVVSAGGCLSHDFDFHEKIAKVGNSIVNLMPDESPDAQFALGVFSVFVTFANTVDQLKKRNSNAVI